MNNLSGGQAHVATSGAESGRVGVSFYLFMFFVLYSYLQVGYRFPILGELRVELLLALLLGPMAIIGIARDSQLEHSNIPVWASLLIFWMAIMVLVSDYPAHSWEVFRDRVLKMAGFGVILYGFVNRPRLALFFLAAYLLAFLKITQEGISGLLTGSMVWENQGVPRLHGSTPNYEHPNSLAGTQLAVLPYILCLIPLFKGILKKALVVQAVLTIVVVVVCGSRTAYLTGFLCLLFLLAGSARTRWKLAIVLFVPMIVVTILPAEYWDRFISTFTGQEIQGDSMGTRKQILIDAIDTFLNNPGGIGIGAFPLHRMQYYGRTQDTHNLLLEVATNLGIIGVALFVGLVTAIYRSLRKSGQRLSSILHKGNDSSVHYRDALIVAAFCKATMWFLFIRLLLGLFGHDLYEVYWWFLAGAALAVETCTQKLKRAPEE